MGPSASFLRGFFVRMTYAAQPTWSTTAMKSATLATLAEKLELVDQLLAGRSTMLEPQDLPGRYGRVVRALDRILESTQIPAVLGGGWAVWRHGYEGRLTRDIAIAVPAAAIDEFLLTASVSGFELLPRREGRWPKMIHKETGIQVDLLPEGARPGTAAKLAPTTIPHPSTMGAVPGGLRYIDLPSLIELKIAAGRLRDQSDVGELVRANPEHVEAIRQHLATVHEEYVRTFDELVRRSREQQDN